ncbi:MULTISPECIES: hypothetical protein [Xenorhabdus]|uniref:hypothetical protein n=1 Tax=Xenorhabdus TaxID=626 RepID=UPI000649AD71|nr:MULTISPECIES: hypothetical protein [Xenorhabdus]KLU14524.1 hypothetical protein AAY47_15810 [Xenorhabdus griffiniae]KOP33315.1 hypothetical protein AFK69_10090 [Xenorhabdus sp. GDc328]
MKFEELSYDSQEAAIKVLADLLRIKYQQTFDLPDNAVRYLGHSVRKAFAALESEEPTYGSDED